MVSYGGGREESAPAADHFSNSTEQGARTLTL
jgi:hypothetical protein